MAHQLAPDLLQELFALRDRIAAAPHGCATELVHNFASLIGRNPSTVYTWLRTHAGYRTGRKKRADAGTTALRRKRCTSSQRPSAKASVATAKPRCPRRWP